jgi:hypothetical protein
MNPPPLFIPSTPDAQWSVIIFGLLRHLLTTAGGAGMLAGLTISDSNLMTVASAIVVVVGAGWSWLQKRQAARNDHEGSLESAVSGKAKMVG